VSYEDKIRISTPEGIDLELVLAGLGSRVGAGLVDGGIRWVVLLVLGIAIAFLTADLGAWMFLGIYAPLFLVIEIGYDIAFETLNDGRSIGKRSFGIRVVRSGGEPVDFRASAVRNLVRLVDGLLTMYMGGVVAILLSRRNQRLGDVAAGTLVIRDRVLEHQHAPALYEHRPPERSGTWDVSLVTAEELGTLRRFLERRGTLSIEARNRIAREMATRIRPKISGAPALIHPEALIEEIVRTKTSRGDQR
jgi:uncharacterized RDD family membrane protein YckC